MISSSGGDASIIPVTDSLQPGQAQPCHPVTPVDSRGETDAGSSLKRKAEEPNEGRNSKLPHLEEQETKDGGSENPDDRNSHVSGPKAPHEAEPPSLQTDSAEERPQIPDVLRTGAKCVPGGPADPRLSGPGYHSAGLLRVKPGRGEPTMSLSCSDKLCRWGVLGFQGALLSHYLEEALYFSAVVVGKCPYSARAMRRAVIDR